MPVHNHRIRCTATEKRAIVKDRKLSSVRLVQCSLDRNHEGPHTWLGKPFSSD